MSLPHLVYVSTWTLSNPTSMTPGIKIPWVLYLICSISFHFFFWASILKSIECQSGHTLLENLVKQTCNFWPLIKICWYLHQIPYENNIIYPQALPRLRTLVQCNRKSLGLKYEFSTFTILKTSIRCLRILKFKPRGDNDITENKTGNKIKTTENKTQKGNMQTYHNGS